MKRHPLKHPRSSESEVIEHVAELRQHEELINEIKLTADKLANDGATRGDLKILSRALKELRYAFKVFAPYRLNRKVSVFGSARTRQDHPCYQTAEAFGRRMAEEGWMVVTGAGGGIMEAAHRGSGREMAMGLNILLPFEQEANPIIAGDPKLVSLKYFFTRKLMFVKEVHAIVTCPGGFGTLDEAFETLTLVQTGKRDLMPLVLLDEPGGTYWSAFLKYVRDELLDNGLISPSDLSLFRVTDKVEEAVEEVLGFYSVYNSMRFIRDRLVLRLHVAPTDHLMQRLNDEFADVCASGRIERAEPHQVEADDAHLMGLPRIALTFNRKAVGRLREMIDVINCELEGYCSVCTE
ncbi:MAG: TIGR00730 family Rossman fold protein [Planctomycetaceae bacterium]|nr:TIGR00730 family Rossman fold protein [Planctomycetaceae bacterium]